MRKQIYDGETNPKGFYRTHNFSDFMRRIGAERITTGQFDLHQTYFFHEQSVALQYNCRLGTNTEITLFGDEEKIGEVEKIVLEAAKKVIG